MAPYKNRLFGAESFPDTLRFAAQRKYLPLQKLITFV